MVGFAVGLPLSNTFRLFVFRTEKMCRDECERKSIGMVRLKGIEGKIRIAWRWWNLCDTSPVSAAFS